MKFLISDHGSSEASSTSGGHHQNSGEIEKQPRIWKFLWSSSVISDIVLQVILKPLTCVNLVWFETWYLDFKPDFRANLNLKKLKICFTMAQLNFSSRNKLAVELICQSCTLRFWKKEMNAVMMNMKRLSSGYQCKKCTISNFITYGNNLISQLLEIFLFFCRLFNYIPRESPDFDVFKACSIRWSSNQQYPSGHPRLHQLLAHNLWNLKR